MSNFFVGFLGELRIPKSPFEINRPFIVYRIEVQSQINLQMGEFLKINKHAVQNKRAIETS